MIDVSCFVGSGPLASASASELEKMLRQEGFTGAAVSPMAGLFGESVSDVDLPDFFRFVPIVDPRSPDLPESLARYRRSGCRAVRVCSAWPLVKSLCGALGLVLILQMRVADPRNVPAGLLWEIPDVVSLARAEPSVPLVVTGARVEEFPSFLGLPSVYADVSLAEEPDVLRRAVAAYGAERLLVGTHAPFLTPAAARAKVSAARLSPAELESVTRGNAVRLGLAQPHTPATT